MSTEAERSHLLIGMVLADLFLVVLLIVWWGFVSLEKTPPKQSETELQQQVSALQLLVAELRSEAADARAVRARLVELEQIIKSLYVKAGYGQAEVGSVGAEEVLAGLRRGSPSCAAGTRNVVLRVRASADGDVADVVAPEFLASIAADDLVPRGQRLEGSDLEALLAKVRVFYDLRKATKRDCRFDYRLEWRTDEAYRRARERFERLFYPAGIAEVS